MPTGRSPRSPPVRRRSTRRAGRSIRTCRGTSAARPRRSSPSSCCSSPRRAASTSTPASTATCPTWREPTRSHHASCSITPAASTSTSTSALVNDPLRQWTPAELIAIAEAAGRVGEPGGPHHYANTNYIILGEIIEQVTGNPWADEVHTRIAEPLGLTHTGVIGDTEPAPGFELIDGSLVDATNRYDPSVGGAAGAMQSTSRDLLVFATALADGTLLSPESQAAMQTFLPAEDLSQFGIDHGYGLGLERYAMDDMTVLGHLGTGRDRILVPRLRPRRGTAVAVTTNTAIAGPSAIMAIEALTAINQTR